jgi:cytochrome c553
MNLPGYPVLSALALLLFSLPMHAVAADEELLHKYSFCLVCHGNDGQGNAIVSAPALAGIEPWYLAQALESYQGALRHTSASALEMQSAARMIGAANLAEVRSFVSLLKPGSPESPPAPAGQLQRGAESYAQYCAACHGSDAEGNEQLAAPGLKRLNGWYLAGAWQAYLTGSRGDDKASPAARQMRQFALSLPADVAIDDLVAFMTR